MLSTKVFKPSVFINRISGILYPSICLLCDQAGQKGLDLCEQCYTRLPWNHTCCQRCALPLPSGNAPLCGACSNKKLFFDYTYSPFLYKDFIQEAITQFKFNQKINYGKLLANLIGQSIEKENLEIPDVIIAVPLHKKRIKSRGFNQSLEIAKLLGKRFNTKVLLNAVKRVRETQAQMELPAKQRVRNVKNAFGLNNNKFDFKNKHVVIVDDVMTTGSTVNEVAKCVRYAGANKVGIWCVARVSTRMCE